MGQDAASIRHHCRNTNVVGHLPDRFRLRTMRTLPTILIIITSNFVYGQIDVEFERFNDLLNLDRPTVEKLLQERHKIKDPEIDVQTPDSIRVSFYATKPTQHFTFFFINDTLKYFGVTYNDISRYRLEKRLRDRFKEDDIENLKGDIFENYTNDTHKAIRLFDNLKDGTGYMLVVYPEDMERYARMVIWKRKKQKLGV